MTLAVTAMAWWERAACRDMPLESFEDEHINWTVVRHAKRICQECPVRSDCLNDAMLRDTRWGIWGGFTTGERDRMAMGSRPRLCFECGLEYIYTKCFACVPVGDNVRIVAILDTLHTAICEYAARGFTDDRIAAMLSAEVGRQIPVTAVKTHRKRWQIASHVIQGKKPDTYDPANVERCEVTSQGFSELTTREQVTLMRRWLSRGETRTKFCRVYRCSGSTARLLIRKIVEDDDECRRFGIT